MFIFHTNHFSLVVIAITKVKASAPSANESFVTVNPAYEKFVITTAYAANKTRERGPSKR